eukprot:CAMPEP_0118725946 /NCGR_PEP_ID=MMETSP0800-20121206/33421_1 /TAXON_ID=210618 ORGANISM="Striatella unipunctata, Strain CCMP2910" /NCGR_SAMPLE_ID=MMETSP0800 /ASSEMBLY_ACC=CAM_ASM_000638 /LENGTH=167 /DNA_ID=CAMNT_0006634699 /DNA_START=1344 /DNA_END=1847 /DNA_ORIENTATION=-
MRKGSSRKSSRSFGEFPTKQVIARVSSPITTSSAESECVSNLSFDMAASSPLKVASLPTSPVTSFRNDDGRNNIFKRQKTHSNRDHQRNGPRFYVQNRVSEDGDRGRYNREVSGGHTRSVTLDGYDPKALQASHSGSSDLEPFTFDSPMMSFDWEDQLVFKADKTLE